MKDVVAFAEKANGPLKSYTVENWNLNSRTGTGISGVFVDFVLGCTYENGIGQENLTMLREKNGGPFEIVQHRFFGPQVDSLMQESMKKATESSSE